MSRPWMPLYIADYLKDTTHLGALESGAYLHLIMDYWVNGKLPEDDRKLARIAKMTDREWRAAKETLRGFFHDDWRHKRIDAEIDAAKKIAESNSDKARDAANKRWSKHAKDTASSMPQACSEHTSSNAPECTLHTSHFTEEKKVGAEAPAGKVLAFGFEGVVTRWDQKTLTKWRKDFPAVDLDATLRVMDAYYADNPRPDGKYFFPAQKWLEKENREAPQRAKQAARDRGDAW